MAFVTKHNRLLKKPPRYFAGSLLLMALLFIATYCRAQLNPYQSIYYQNRYLANPAMAGLNTGFDINLAAQQQWSSFPGAPKSQALTFSGGVTDKIGLGINVVDDQSGVFRQTRIMDTYAYHVPLSDENQKLNFGFSIGLTDSRISYSDVVGDLTDDELSAYNRQGIIFDGDLGLSYTSDNLFVEGVFPNVNINIFHRNGAQVYLDRTIFFSAISYKFMLSDDLDAFSLEPLAAFRDIKGVKSIVDMGLNFKMSQYHFNLQAIYHSNNDIALGAVFEQPTYAINFDYSVYTGQIASYTNGAFELGIRVKLFGND